MTRTSVRTARAYRGLRTPQASRAAGGLLVGMAGVATVAAAVLVIPGSGNHTPDAVTSQSAARPSLVAAPPALPTSLPVRHASRGGGRTALPPFQYVTTIRLRRLQPHADLAQRSACEPKLTPARSDRHADHGLGIDRLVQRRARS